VAILALPIDAAADVGTGIFVPALVATSTAPEVVTVTPDALAAADVDPRSGDGRYGLYGDGKGENGPGFTGMPFTTPGYVCANENGANISAARRKIIFFILDS